MSPRAWKSTLVLAVVFWSLVGFSRACRADLIPFVHLEEDTVAYFKILTSDGAVMVIENEGCGLYTVEFELTWPVMMAVVAVGHTGLVSDPSNAIFRIPAADTCASIDFNHDGVIGGPDFAGLMQHGAVSKFATLLRCFGEAYDESA